jgi:hypothetical protein
VVKFAVSGVILLTGVNLNDNKCYLVVTDTELTIIGAEVSHKKPRLTNIWVL